MFFKRLPFFLFLLISLTCFYLNANANWLEHQGNIITTSAQDVVVDGDFAYVADGSAGIRVVDISNKSVPTLTATIPTTSSVLALQINGDYLYSAELNAGLRIYNISNPVEPAFAGEYVTQNPANDIEVRNDGSNPNHKIVYVVERQHSPGPGVPLQQAIHILDVYINDPGYGAGVHTFSKNRKEIGFGTEIGLDWNNNYIYVASNQAGFKVFSNNLYEYSSYGCYANDVVVANDVAYVAAGKDGLLLFDVRNKLDMKPVGKVGEKATHWSALMNARDVEIYDIDGDAHIDIAAVSFGDAGTVLIDVSNPAEPLIMDYSKSNTNAMGAAVSGEYIYEACDVGGINIYKAVKPIWGDNFVGFPGELITNWEVMAPNKIGFRYAVSNQDISKAEIKSIPGSTGSCKIRSEIIPFNSDYKYIHIKIDDTARGSNVVLQIQKEGSATPWLQLLDTDQPGLYSIDYKQRIEDAPNQSLSDWNGNFRIELWVDSSNSNLSVVLDHVWLTKWTYPDHPSTALMDEADNAFLAHFMLAYKTGTTAESWHGWNYDGNADGDFDDPEDHNPQNTVSGDSEKRDVASIYYPVAGFSNPPSNTTSLSGPYDQQSESIIQQQIDYMNMLYLDGGTFDLESYWQLVPQPGGGYKPQEGTLSWQAQTMRTYLRKFREYNALGGKKFYAIPVYEDKAQWLRTNYPGMDREDCVRHAHEDLRQWANLFLEFSDVMYKINGRPVFMIFSYETAYDNGGGMGRLTASEIQQWLQEWGWTHINSPKPFLITNLVDTKYPQYLETDGVKYSDVFEGYFEWPVFDGGDSASPPSGYSSYRPLAKDKNYWSNAGAIYRQKIIKNQYSFICGGAWPGFDDWGVNGWGNGRRCIPRKDDTTGEYTFDYHLNRIVEYGYPLKHIVTWNDWNEGSNVEPAVEFNEIYQTTGNIFWLKEEFEGTQDQQPGGWLDEDQDSSYNAQIAYSSTASNAVIYPAGTTQGKVVSPVQSTNCTEFPRINIDISGIAPTTEWRIAVQEIGGAEQHFYINDYTSASGMRTYDYRAITGWDGLKTFRVELYVQGTSTPSYLVDTIQFLPPLDADTRMDVLSPYRKIRSSVAESKDIVNVSGNLLVPKWIRDVRENYPIQHQAQVDADKASNELRLQAFDDAETTIRKWSDPLYNEATPTPTPTPAAGEYWYDGFTGFSGLQVAQWEDESDNQASNVQIYYNQAGTAARITRTAESTWGSTASQTFNCDVNAYPIVEIKVDEVGAETSWKLGLQEVNGSWQYWDLGSSTNSTGTESFNIPATTGLSGSQTFKLAIVVEGGAGSYIEVDYIRITNSQATPTSTITPTPSPTMTVTSTPTPSMISTYFGGSGDDQIEGMYVDINGYIYIVGQTSSTNLNVSLDAYDQSHNGSMDAFLTKLSPGGNSVEYCTYIGGSGNDYARGVTCDDQGNIYIVGSTWSSDFPVSITNLDNSLDGGRDAFVMKFNANGEMEYSTYWGGGAWDYGFCIAVENEDEVYIGGFTHGGFPVSTGAAQENFGGLGDGFVTQLNLATNTMVYSTYVGGQYYEGTNAITVKNGKVYLASGSQSPDYPVTQDAIDSVNTVTSSNNGSDGAFTVLSADGSTFEYSTFIGPDDSPNNSGFNDILVDSAGNVYLVGESNEQGMITTTNAIQSNHAGDNDGIIIKLNPTYDTRLYSSYFGGSGADYFKSISMDLSGNIWIAGVTNSGNFPAGASGEGGLDMFAVNLSPEGQLLWSERFGGSGDDAILSNYVPSDYCSNTNKLCIAGSTASSDMPITTGVVQSTYGGGDHDSFVVKLSQPLVTYTPTFTPTMTLTATATPTPTVTVTPTATPIIPINAFFDDFIGTYNESVPGWEDQDDNSTYLASMNYHGSTPSYARVYRSAYGTWGKVLSPQINCDVSLYKYVEVKVGYITPAKTWKIGVQEIGGAWEYYDLSTSSSTSGTFEYNIPNITGWSGEKTFAVQLVIEGEIATYFHVDFVRVHRGTVQGAAGHNVVSVNTSTPTPTISPTPSSTATSVNTATPSPTITATATPTPWLTTNEVRAFPNPARDQMTFAYTVSGGVHVILDIYKITGERIARVDEYKDGGSGQTLRTVWDAVSVSPGIYIARLKITDENGKVVMDQKKKVALIK